MVHSLGTTLALSVIAVWWAIHRGVRRCGIGCLLTSVVAEDVHRRITQLRNRGLGQGDIRESVGRKPGDVDCVLPVRSGSPSMTRASKIVET
jgi:hypothetical protein